MLRYLRGTANYTLVYGQAGKGWGDCDQLAVPSNDRAVEIFVDASFHPGSDRSQTGVIVTWAGCPIAWLSCRQATAGLSTTEAELNAALDGMTLGSSLLPLVCELLKVRVRPILYGDNLGCCSLLQQPQGSWRTRHLRLKAQHLERVAEEDFLIFHLPGQYMLGDVCTKVLPPVKIKDLMQMMKFHMDTTNLAVRKLWGKPTTTEQSQSRDLGTSCVAVERGCLSVCDGACEVATDIEPGGDRLCEPASNTGGDVFKTGCPSLAVASRALRVLSLASALSEAAGKVTITVEKNADEGFFDRIVAVAGVLTLVGLLGVLWCLKSRLEDRQRRAKGLDEAQLRALSVEGSEAEWSLIGESPDRDGHVDDSRQKEGSRSTSSQNPQRALPKVP